MKEKRDAGRRPCCCPARRRAGSSATCGRRPVPGRAAVEPPDRETERAPRPRRPSSGSRPGRRPARFRQMPSAAPARSASGARKFAISCRPCSCRSTRGGTARPTAAVRCASAHDHAAVGPGDAPARRAAAGDAQRVVADDLEALRECSSKSGDSSWRTGAQTAVRGPRARGRPAAEVGDALMAEADTEHGQSALLDASAHTPKSRGAVRAARTRRDPRCCRSPGRSARPRSGSSLRTTIGSSPFTSAISWKRLYVNES